ncbi:carboxypeptidase regulatory-like domain-containing protein [Tamlana sp. 2_MG-2023]|uniref:carboxypeptidase regulatory-like domain-containing protein n=1 Tax=unclassified Tamlana TaxID=2614803 RepID=UPI0026E1BF80|nr:MULTISPECIES: carboxypeptidase regulatory-like domain-containing protein [unclassified Tamlana]MDO6761528.1 carboxypeptidase regulatory-like domain-containing protein [Tamlana sp. 2_MG-2023]MDO6792378.1 carboxypeptidase regulatory-like domain-containing protein [Tamlana sp. 1_MG-2023]
MTRFFYTLLFMGIFCSSWSQEASIKGNIIDNTTKKPVVNALVYIEDTTTNQKTNELGEFILEENVPLGKITVVIEMLGYSSRKFDIEILEGKQASVKNIKLYPRKKPKAEKENLKLTGTSLTGIITHKQTRAVISDARVSIVDAYMTTKTDENGRFVFNGQVPDGPIVLKISKDGYTSKKYYVFISSGKIANIDGITLGNDLYDIENQQINTFAEDQLFDGNATITNNATFYQSSNSTFLRTASYQFSSAFFKARGQDFSEGDVLINGITYNSPLSGSADWNGIGGLDEIFQDNDLSYGLEASNYSLGGNLGSLNMNTRASAQRQGGKIAYLSSNRRYSHGIQATYATGVSPKGFSLAVSASKRTAFNEGYFDGTPYDSNSFLISAEKQINSSNAINFTGFFNSTSRSGRSANTNEVFHLKDHKYNSYWGELNDDITNSTKQKISQPYLMLNHYLNVGARVKVQTNISYNFGTNSRSSIDFLGASIDGSNQITPSNGENPDPSFYTKLPSFFLADENNPDYEGAVLAQQAFQQDGQINWIELFQYNINSGLNTSTYALYDEVVKHSNFNINSIADIRINSLINLNAAFGYSSYVTNQYAQMDNLLGGSGYLDVNTSDGTGDAIQSDLLNPNRIVQANETFRYHYELNRRAFNAFIQARYKYEQFDAFLGADITHSNNYRVGKYQNGRSPYLSYGKGNTYTFLDYNFKGGLSVKLNPKHSIGLRALYGNNAPMLNHMFLNARESDNPRDLHGISTVSDLIQAPELIEIDQSSNFSSELKYTYNGAKFNAQVAGYLNTQSGGISNKTFAGNSINNEASSTIQEVLTNIDKRYMGIEIGASYPILKSLKLKTAVAMGNFIYTNNPELHYIISGSGVLDLGEAFLQDYHVSSTPTQVFSLGFEYRDEDHWWFEVMGNYFADNYLDVNPYLRTRDFFLDTNDAIFSNYNPEYAAYILKQNTIENYLTINLFGGKYWKIKENQIGFKAGVNNALGQNHNIAGFETKGQLKYDTLLEDAKRQQPLYGNRFWKGYGATYFVNIYYRF